VKDSVVAIAMAIGHGGRNNYKAKSKVQHLL